MKAKKSFGQHFLNREDMAERIANSFTRTSEFDNIVEVGPGKAVLSKYLFDLYPNMIAIEADRDMVAYLKQYLPLLSVTHADFLRVPLDKVFEEKKPFGLIGNFPYNISSQIVFRMIKYRDLIPEMVGMFQKEMAERIIASPGGKDFGVISLLTQAYYEGEYLFTVPPDCFSPPPKVNSAVIRLSRKKEPLGCSDGLFKSVVKQAFSQRRKMLRNTLKGWLPPEEIADEELFTKRPEKLSLEDFVSLTNRVEIFRKEKEKDDSE